MAERLFRKRPNEIVPEPPEGMEVARLHGQLVFVSMRFVGESRVGNTPYTRRQLDDLRGLVTDRGVEDLEEGRFNYARMLRLEDTTL